MSLKVITIDYWNTLFDSSNGIERNKLRNEAIKSTLIQLNPNITENDIKDAIYAAWGHFNKIWTEQMQTPTPRQSVEFFWDYLKLPKNEEAIDFVVNSFSTAILDLPPNLMQDASYVLEQLSKDFKLAIISDTGFSPGSVLKILMERAGILDYFSAFSFSDETNVAKPHPQAYLKVFNELNVRPEEALHIGDIEQTDILGAKKLGMKAIRFSGDPSFLSKPNAPKTIADAECFTWNEVLIEIRRLSE